MKRLLELIGRQVVTRDEGVRLGVLIGLLVDQGVGRIVALLFRTTRRSPEQWVKISDVVTVGRDLVLVSSESKIGADVDRPGYNLAAYRRTWVTTLSGARLGRLTDVGTEGDDWAISELELEGGASLAIDGTDLFLGDNTILVPNEFASRLRPGVNPGAFSRFGRFIRAMMGREPLPDKRAGAGESLKSPVGTEVQPP